LALSHLASIDQVGEPTGMSTTGTEVLEEDRHRSLPYSASPMNLVRNWADDLNQVVLLNQAVKPADAEERLKRVIQECSPDDLQVLGSQLTAALNSFFPKRRRLLDEFLRQHLESDASHSAVSTPVDAASRPRPATIPIPMTNSGPAPADTY